MRTYRSVKARRQQNFRLLLSVVALPLSTLKPALGLLLVLESLSQVVALRAVQPI